MSADILNLQAAVEDMRSSLVWIGVAIFGLWFVVVIGGLILSDIRRAMLDRESNRWFEERERRRKERQP